MKNKLAYTIVRILLGLSFIFFGATKFYPLPSAPLAQPAADFLTAMANTAYFIPFIGIAELLVGILLLFNIWVPFSMTILSALMINVILFNAFLAPSVSGFIMLVILVVLQVYIMFCTWHAYKPLFTKTRIVK